MTASRLHGGCHCGAVRLAIDTGEIIGTGYCHCSICRRLSGGPVNAWLAVNHGKVEITGSVSEYQSSAKGRRGFCGACGAQIWYAGNDDAYITLNAPSFDDPEALALRPAMHIYHADRLAWFDVSDALPRYPAGPPAEAK